MKVAPLIGLLGVLVAAMSAQFNDVLTVTAVQDVGGEVGISTDASTWLPTLYVSGEVIGMSVAPTLATIFTLRRFALFAIVLSLAPTLLLAFSTSAGPLLMLRFLQGVAGGLTIPLLMMTALRVLDPPMRLYGLAVYALSATFAPNLANTLTSFWIDKVEDYRFLYLQAAPLGAVAMATVWWGVAPEPPQYAKLKDFDWIGLALVAVGVGSLAVLLEQGDRLDWFESPVICLAGLLAAIGVPLLVLRDLLAPQPLCLLSLLKRRNFAFTVCALVLLLVVSLAGSQIPLNYLEQVQGYRPLQAQTLSLELALSQLLFLPLTARLLDVEAVDSRWVVFSGLVLIIAACLGASRLDSAWVRDQFYIWQALLSLGTAFVIMSLLMMGTNAITKKEEGPYASSLVNTPRAISEAVGVWAVELITRWRGGLHRARIVDVLGQRRALSPAGPQPSLPGQVSAQVATLVASDSFVVMAALAAALVVMLAIIPVRTYPPRIALQH